MSDTPMSEFVFTRQQRIAELAKQSPERAILSLNHYVDQYWLDCAFARTRQDGAVGVDGQTAGDYAANLESNLQSLLNRAKSGTYHAPPVRRVHIPKGPGSTETRPLGIPAFEDKLLQRAVVMLLEPIYEQDFLDCSYGFRPGRSAHQALAALREGLMRVGGGWVLDLDICKFFDTLQRASLREMLRKRIRDADDVVMVFTHESDARRVFEVLPKRFAKFGLALHPEKTRLVPFCRPTASRVPTNPRSAPGTFDLLGFTNYWGRSRNGYWVVKRKTAKSRLR